MSLFHYKALNTEGKTVEGVLEAPDRFTLYHLIKKNGDTPLFTEEVKKGIAFNIGKIIPFLDRVSQHDKIILARNLSKMLTAGLPVTRSLSIMEREAHGALQSVLKKLGEQVAKGNTLSESMKSFPKVFSTLFVSMVKAGEESGNLAVALENISIQLEKTYMLTKKIRGALMYPVVILCLMVVIGVLMMLYMVPTLTSTFVGLGASLPLSTRIIIGISDVLQNYFVWFFAALAGFAVFCVFVFKSKAGQRAVDWSLLKMPVFGELVREINSARTARTLSSLLLAGVDIIVAVSVTENIIQNSYYKEVLAKAGNTIQRGDPISAVFTANSHLYPLFVGEMMAVGEETGKIGDMLNSVALFYEDDVDQKTKDISSLIEPLLMIFIGVAVGFFALAVITPIYSLGDAIK